MDTSPLNYKFGEFVLDLARGCLFKDGVEIKLRPKVFETLKYLVEHSGRLIGKQELMQAVWPDTFVTDDSLVQCTLELRRALGDRSQQLIKTLPRRGYLFSAEVVRVELKSDPPSDRDPAGASDARGSNLPNLSRRRHELPTPRTSLIGREQEVQEASHLLSRADVRLLTLTGPGGAGKTRLAIAIAIATVDKFEAGVQFVRLASIMQPDLVVTAIADALGIKQVANRTVPQLISDWLQPSRPFLLLLDNFEHVLSAAATVAEILEICPSIKILVTSRSGLRIYGEQEFPVTPLAQDFAIELFAQRATAVWPGFSVTEENESAVRDVCSRLDGLPLAIELAAARTKVLSPSAMLDRLESRLQLLTGGALDLPERQQTLRGTIDWSHDLLNEPERKLFRRLSVFAGGSTVEAAEAVCNTGNDLGVDVFEGLSSLVDKNLVQQADRIDSHPRFSMLETIGEYSLDRLTKSGELTATRRAHSAYCLVLAEEGNPALSAEDRSQWLADCDLEIDNFRFALDWLFQTKDIDWALRLCVALFRFWDMREHMTEGRSRLEAVLGLAGDKRPKERSRILHFLGALSTTQGDYTAAEDFLQQSLSIYEELGDEWGIAASLNAIAITARDKGDYASAQSNFERSVACWRMLPDRLALARCLHNLSNVVKVRGDYSRARWALREAAEIFEALGDRSGAAWSINQEGDIAREQSEIAAAQKLYQRALAAFRDAGDEWGSGRSLTDLGYIAAEQGDYAVAHSLYREALEIFERLGHRRGTSRVLEGFAYLAIAQGHAARALKLAAAAANSRRLICAPLPQAEQSKLDHILEPAWKAISQTDGKRAWAEGSAMTLENAIRYSFEQPSSVTSD